MVAICSNNDICNNNDICDELTASCVVVDPRVVPKVLCTVTVATWCGPPLPLNTPLTTTWMMSIGVQLTLDGSLVS
jgi:hypothetical protein